MTPPLPKDFDLAILDVILTVDLSSILANYRTKRRTSAAVLRLGLLSIFRTEGIPMPRFMRAALVGVGYDQVRKMFPILKKNGLITYSQISFGRRRMCVVSVNREKLMSLPRMTWEEMTAKQKKMSEMESKLHARYRAKKKLNAKPVTSSLCACQ